MEIEKRVVFRVQSREPAERTPVMRPSLTQCRKLFRPQLFRLYFLDRKEVRGKLADEWRNEKKTEEDA